MKTVKVFISSTFKDMNAERDVLIKKVFPKLKEEAESKLGVRIQEVDLRWGITEDEAKKGSIVDLCLSGIDECQPYFLCMLGKRYGWIPAPIYINADVIEDILKMATDDESKVLRKAYGRSDEIVYILDISLSDQEKEAARIILERYGVKEAGQSITEQEIEHVVDKNSIPMHITQLDMAIKASKNIILDEEEKYVLSYYARAGSENVWYLKPGIKEDDKIKLSAILKRIGGKFGYHTFFFVREDCGEDDAEYFETQQELRSKLDSLKKRIESKKEDLDSYAHYQCAWDSEAPQGQHKIKVMDEFGEKVYEMLWEHLKNNPELKNDQNEKDGLEREEELQLKYVDSRTYNFCGRTDLINSLKETINLAMEGKLISSKAERKTGYILLTGEPGAGKSSVMAKLFLELQQQYKEGDTIVIGRFVGATGQSTSPRNLLLDFCETLKSKCEIIEDIPLDYKELKLAFANFLNKTNKRIIILIDAINQLRKDGMTSMNWLPKEVRPGVCIFLSLVDDEKKQQPGSIEEDRSALESLRSWYLPPYEIRLKALKDEEKKEIAVNYLRQYNKKLADEQINLLTIKQESHLPLFMQVALEELRMVSKYEELSNYFEETLKDNTEEMFEQALIRSENDLELSMPGRGKQLFIDFVKNIAAGRNGMTELDLRLLLSDWQKIDKDMAWEDKKKVVNELKLDDYRWGELKRSLRAFLFLSGDEWNFFHQQLKQAVGKRYLKTEEDRRKTHKEIADYLVIMGYEHGTTARDLPHHLNKAGKTDELRKVLLTFKWMYEKLRATNINELVSDYDLLDENEIKLVKEAITLSTHIVNKDIKQLPTQIYGRLVNFKKSNNRLSAFLDQIEKWEEFIWIMPINACFKNAGGSLKRTLSGHSQSVCGSSITPDGKNVISCSMDRTLKVWDIETGEELKTLTGHQKEAGCVRITPSGKQAVSASMDTTLKVWDMETGQEIRTLYGHTDFVRGVSITPDGKQAISASTDTTLMVWDLETGEKIKTLSGHTDEVTRVSITPDGNKAVSASKDKTLKVWEIETGMEMRTLSGHTNEVTEVCITPDGRKAVSASKDGTIMVWDLQTGEFIRALIGHAHWVLGVCITPDGKKVVSSSLDKTVKVWDIETGKLYRTLDGHSSTVSGVSITPDGKKAVTSSYDTTLKVWDIETEQEERTISGHTRTIMQISLMADGKKAVSVSDDQTLKIWDIETGEVTTTLRGHRREIKGVCVTSDGRKAVSASVDRDLKVWDLETGQEVFTLSGHTDEVKNVSITPDGKKAISASSDKTLKVWDIETGEELRTLSGHSADVTGVSITHDGKKAVSVSCDQTLKVWDINTGEQLRNLNGNESYNWVTEVSITPDDQKVLSVSGDWTAGNWSLKVWNFETGAQRRTLTGHTQLITGACLTPDGRQAVSSSFDQTLKVWDMETGKEIRTLAGSLRGLTGVCVTPDGKNAVSFDQTLKMWELETGKRIATFIGEEELAGAKGCSVAPDGRIVIRGVETPTMYFLKICGKDI